jgi:hypothetical protein
MGFSHFITLTNDNNNEKIRVNVGNIVSYSRNGKDISNPTYVAFNEGGYYVTESPELIDTYLRESLCSVKERHEPTKSKAE